jgi:hypothetical protein
MFYIDVLRKAKEISYKMSNPREEKKPETSECETGVLTTRLCLEKSIIYMYHNINSSDNLIQHVTEIGIVLFIISQQKK